MWSKPVDDRTPGYKVGVANFDTNTLEISYKQGMERLQRGSHAYDTLTRSNLCFTCRGCAGDGRHARSPGGTAQSQDCPAHVAGRGYGKAPRETHRGRGRGRGNHPGYQQGRGGRGGSEIAPY